MFVYARHLAGDTMICTMASRYFTGQAMHVWRNIEALSRNHCCFGKAVSITYSECVCIALVIQHPKRMRRIVLSSVARQAVRYYFTFSHIQHDFREKNVVEHDTYVLLLLTTFVWIVSHSKKNSARYCHKCTSSSRKVPVILVRF